MKNLATIENYTEEHGDTLQSGDISVTVGSDPDFNWAGVTIAVVIKLRDQVIHTLAPTPDLSVAGTLKFAWQLSAAQTTAMQAAVDYSYKATYTLGTYINTVTKGTIRLEK